MASQLINNGENHGEICRNISESLANGMKSGGSISSKTLK
jgi:hypothetical protein